VLKGQRSPTAPPKEKKERERERKRNKVVREVSCTGGGFSLGRAILGRGPQGVSKLQKSPGVQEPLSI